MRYNLYIKSKHLVERRDSLLYNESAQIMKAAVNLINNNILYFGFALALISTLGSLYFSEILHFPPCVLCWYQRIALYPLVIILAIGIRYKDKLLPKYILPFSIIGMLISFYHNLLYYKILPESAQPCLLGVSCTTKFIEWFGFITIPFLSFMAFLIITLCMVIYERNLKLKVQNSKLTKSS